ncbi:MAG: MMPL family transporter, partial [Acidimicrobiales bacterium]
MNSLTSFVLRHRRLVMLAWLIVALAGAATLTSTTKRLSVEFKMPGQASYVADAKIAALYQNGGGGVPVVVAVTAPAGSEAIGAQADRVIQAAAAAVPGSRVADQANTGDAHFVTRDGRTSYGLIFSPPNQGGFGKDTTPAITAAAAKAAPAGWQAGVTGLAQLETGTSHKGTSTLTEAMLGGIGSMAVLAFVFASFIAIVPLLMAMVAI